MGTLRCSYPVVRKGDGTEEGHRRRKRGGRGASALPLFSEKPVNIVNTYTFILGAENFSPPTFCMLPPPLRGKGRGEGSRERCVSVGVQKEGDNLQSHYVCVCSDNGIAGHLSRVLVTLGPYYC